MKKKNKQKFYLVILGFFILISIIALINPSITIWIISIIFTIICIVCVIDALIMIYEEVVED